MSELDYCWSHGPRIGDEGKPVCFRRSGHKGQHRSHQGSGFRATWGEPLMQVHPMDRDEFWTPGGIDE